jgi:hypothetical protein
MNFTVCGKKGIRFYANSQAEVVGRANRQISERTETNRKRSAPVATGMCSLSRCLATIMG